MLASAAASPLLAARAQPHPHALLQGPGAAQQPVSSRSHAIRARRASSCAAAGAGQDDVRMQGEPTPRQVSATGTTGSSSSSTSGRRGLLLAAQALVAAASMQLGPAAQPAAAAPEWFERGMRRYNRKKALDPLDFYVPVVIQAREQLSEAGQVMAVNAELARSLMRNGPFGAIRENVRVLGEYAVMNKQAEQAAPLIQGFFRALEDFDLELKAVAKGGKEYDAARAQELLARSEAGLDALLATVPADVIERSRTLLEVARKKSLAAAEAEAAAAGGNDSSSSDSSSSSSVTVMGDDGMGAGL